MTLAVLLALCAAAVALPQISLPFNAQVPAMARAGDEYRFDLSPSTVRTSLGGITYSLAQAPSWLQISGNGTLFGIPSAQDVGSVSFVISATDKTGSSAMAATLVIANSPNPQIGGDAYNTLSTTGARCGISCILLPPSTGFSFGFPTDAFEGTTGSLSYYATNSDHTPLPAWIKFDPTYLIFSGTTPPAASLPESTGILFIVAEVPGYASGQLEFTISVSQHQLIFVPAKDAVTQSARNAVDVQNLRGNLWLDGRPINDQDFAGATTDAPSWLQFDSSTIGFSGNPPTTSTQTISIWARDTYGDVASMVLEISFAPGELYNGSIGVLNATAGAYFLYQLSPTDFPERNVSISVGFGAASGWLKFDRQNLSMAGLIPLAAPSEIINAGLTVTSADGKNEYFQSFEIRIISAPKTTTPASIGKTVQSGRLAGVIAGSVVVAVFTVLLIICSLLCYNSCAKKPRSVERRPSTFKRFISKPLVFLGGTTGYSADSGLDQENQFSVDWHAAEDPPRVDLAMNHRTDGDPFQVFQSIYGMQSRSESQTSADRSHPFRRPATPWIQRLAVKKQSKQRPISAPPTVINYPHSAKVGLFAPTGAEDVVPRPGSRPSASLQARRQESESMPELISQSRATFNKRIKWQGHTTTNPENHLLPQEQSMPDQGQFDLPARISFGFPAQGNDRGRMVRPVSRRSPYNATFFAGGSSMRRKSSAAGRRFAEFGLGLSTIDASPDLEAGDSQVIAGGAEFGFEQYPHRYSMPRTYTNSSGSGWETATSAESVSSEKPTSRFQTLPLMSGARPPMSWRRSQVVDQRLWSSEQDMASSVYSGSLGEVSALAESRPGSVSPKRDKARGIPAQVPIMERTRASYRRGAADERPAAQLSLNETLAGKGWAKWSGRASDRRRLVRGSVQRPVSVDRANGGKGSLRGEFVKGDEAFI